MSVVLTFCSNQIPGFDDDSVELVRIGLPSMTEAEAYAENNNLTYYSIDDPSAVALPV